MILGSALRTLPEASSDQSARATHPKRPTSAIEQPHIGILSLGMRALGGLPDMAVIDFVADSSRTQPSQICC
jgi:hypothetical protein